MSRTRSIVEILCESRCMMSLLKDSSATTMILVHRSIGSASSVGLRVVLPTCSNKLKFRSTERTSVPSSNLSTRLSKGISQQMCTAEFGPHDASRASTISHKSGLQPSMSITSAERAGDSPINSRAGAAPAPPRPDSSSCSSSASCTGFPTTWYDPSSSASTRSSSPGPMRRLPSGLSTIVPSDARTPTGTASGIRRAISSNFTPVSSGCRLKYSSFPSYPKTCRYTSRSPGW
mmetsp:Transcript_8488/g.28125  ORF Transcript_8488/g.28125 Transcript_8488/m.28125 type:complete len:233 (-) Transcript_8488:108-806(-)